MQCLEGFFMHERSNDQVMCCRRLVVVGAGYIGCEQACIFNNLGTEVHFIVRQVIWHATEQSGQVITCRSA